jgi:hypothetical protein
MARSWGVPIALLTPIGIMHLKSAAGMPKVAFGTRARDSLQEFATVGGPGAPVLFYASYNDGATRPTVTWTAEFVDVTEAAGNGAPPNSIRRLRPRSTRDEDRAAGWWYAYYTVENLRELGVASQVLIADLRSWGSDRPLSPAFIPEGPIIVSM